MLLFKCSLPLPERLRYYPNSLNVTSLHKHPVYFSCIQWIENPSTVCCVPDFWFLFLENACYFFFQDRTSFFSRQGFSMKLWSLTWHLLCISDWPWTLCFPSTGTKGVCHQHPALKMDVIFRRLTNIHNSYMFTSTLINQFLQQISLRPSYLLDLE